jgi:hypothetical protein
MTRCLRVFYNFSKVGHDKIPDMRFELVCLPIVQHAIKEEYFFTLILEDVSPDPIWTEPKLFGCILKPCVGFGLPS